MRAHGSGFENTATGNCDQRKIDGTHLPPASRNRRTVQEPNDARLWPLPRWEGEQSHLEGNAPRVQGATPHFFLFSAICSGVGCSIFLNGISREMAVVSNPFHPAFSV